MKKAFNTEEELQKCKDSIVYYWNNYIRREDQQEMTEEEYFKYRKMLSENWFKPRRCKQYNTFHPLSETKCFKKL